MTRDFRERAFDLGLVLGTAVLSVIAARAGREGLSFYPQLFPGGLVRLAEVTHAGVLEGLFRFGPQDGPGCLIACALLWFRRRWPVAVTAASIAMAVVTPAVVPLVAALVTLAASRPPRTVAWLSALALVPIAGSLLLNPLSIRGAAPVATGCVVVGAAVGWGLFVRGVRERAERAETEGVLRAVQAQRQAREDIAREMHDVLAHRLSLLSVHAGALEFHPGASADEVQTAAGVIRENAHLALEDLQQILQVLRAPVPAPVSAPAPVPAPGGHPAETREQLGTEPPQPTLDGLMALVDEARSAGADVELDQRLRNAGSADAFTGRTAYRVVQEALTNARKHAPGSPVTVSVEGGPGEGLIVEVRNPVPHASRTTTPIPGSSRGLIGMAERASLAGGRLTHGCTGPASRSADAEFRIHAWLPWSA